MLLQSACTVAPSRLCLQRTKRTEFLITTSIDGHTKLWKKQESGIEFVKHYRAHLSPVVAVSASVDGQLFATVAEDKMAKVFDVVNFGESNCYRKSVHVKYGRNRYDKHYQLGLYTSCLLLGTQAWSSSGSLGCVRLVSSGILSMILIYSPVQMPRQELSASMMAVGEIHRWRQ